MRKIKIVIHKDGSRTVEALNMIGPDCTTVTGPFEQGEPVGERVLKPEYYLEPGETVTEDIRVKE